MQLSQAICTPPLLVAISSSSMHVELIASGHVTTGNEPHCMPEHEATALATAPSEVHMNAHTVTHSIGPCPRLFNAQLSAAHAATRA